MRGKGKYRSEDLKDIDKITFSSWYRFSSWLTKLWQILYTRNWEENNWSLKDKNSTKEIHFINNLQNVLNVDRVCRHSIIGAPVDLKNAESKAKTEIDHFLLFITMKCWLLFYTILIKRSLLVKLPADFNKDFKYSFVNEVCEMELKAFIGLFLYRGLYKLNTMGFQKLFV